MAIRTEDVEVEGSAQRGRYLYRFADGAEAELTYMPHSDGVVAMTHTYTPPSHRGHGIAAVLVDRAVADFRQAGLRIVPACWFVREEFERHPDWAELLHRG